MPEINKPCKVSTEQGFSVTYKEKFLYSKYNPQKQIISLIQNTQILPGTIILCFSPCLGYGIPELLQKLPENCAVLLCEKDKELYNFSLEEQVISDGIKKNQFAFLTEEELYKLPVIMQENNFSFSCGYKINAPESYRRVLRLDFSNGVQFYRDFYKTLENACIASNKQVWTNRITLTKFGRKFSMNFLKNLKNLPYSEPIENYIGKITKPILVLGTGESVEKIIPGLKTQQTDFFILCADTVYPLLRQNKIKPDGIVLEEAQSVIAKSFIGNRINDIHIFQSLSSLPHVNSLKTDYKNITFYTTEYAKTEFISALKKSNLLPYSILPFGSVGLSAFYLANLFKKDNSVPVLYYGLDFAYSIGKTHVNGSTAHLQRLLQNSRINPIENYACFCEPSIRIFENLFTTPILNSYAQTFSELKNLKIEIEKESLREDILSNSNETYHKKITDWIENEKKSLQKIKDILTGKIKLSEEESRKQLEELIKPREYLYLHFPDGFNYKTDLSFLKRIRTEIDFFLKFL